MTPDAQEGIGCVLLIGVTLIGLGVGVLSGAGYGLLVAGGIAMVFVMVSIVADYWNG